MEYVQMTLDDWIEMKRKLRQELLGVKQSFVRIGYALRRIDDQKLYEQDGYRSIAEFAKEEYGLEPSTTSRFMSINREYSIDGYSEHLRPEFADLGRSQLEEMLKLPENDRKMIQPETSRQDIRELKKFNKSEPAAGIADDLQQLIEKFYQDNPKILNAVFSEPGFEEATIKRFIEIVNPGGNRSYKKGIYFLMMYESRVAVKKFGADPIDLTWWEFWTITQEIFGESAAGPNTWQNYFKQEEEKTEPDNTGDHESDDGGEDKAPESGNTDGTIERENDREPDGEPEEKMRHEHSEPEGSESQGERIAPAKKTEEISVNTEAEAVLIPAEKEEKPEKVYPEIMDKPFGTRKDFFDTLTAYGLADYLNRTYREHPEKFSERFEKTGDIEKWLLEEVDDKGRSLEVEE